MEQQAPIQTEDPTQTDRALTTVKLSIVLVIGIQHCNFSNKDCIHYIQRNISSVLLREGNTDAYSTEKGIDRDQIGRT